MADPLNNPDEQALRRRARRRLVGSLALALLAVVVLPMIFEPEPKPLGDDVEIVIPGQDTPFKPLKPDDKATPTSGQPSPDAAAPRVTPAPELTQPAAKDAAPAAADAGKIRVADNSKATTPEKPKATEAKPSETKPQEAKAGSAKPAPKPVETKAGESSPAAKAPPAASSEAKPSTQAKPEAQPAVNAKPAEAPAAVAKPYFLQLGSFGAEANAKQLSEKAKVAGFPVKTLGGQGGYKVRVGPYANKEKAVEAQAKLKAKGFTPVLVAP